jgi:hypothetical protein
MRQHRGRQWSSVPSRVRPSSFDRASSLRETATLIELARRLDYMRPADLAKAEDTGEQIGPMLTRLIKSLQTPGRR